MPKAVDPRAPLAEPKTTPSEAAPLEFEKVSLEDAKKTLETTGAPRQDKTPHADRARGTLDNERLRDEAVKWLEQLPAHVRPVELARRYPRIVNQLSVIWKRPTACEPYLDDLLIDRRGGRKGFVLAIVSELTDLRTYYAKLYPRSAIEGAWKDGDYMR